MFCINKCIINLIEKDSNSHRPWMCYKNCIVIQLPKCIQNESRSHFTWGKGTIAQVGLLWIPVCLSFSVQWCAHKIPLRRITGFLQMSTMYKASHAESRFPFPSYRPRYWLNINHGIIWSENTTQSLKGRAKFPLFCLKQFLRYSKTNKCSCIQSAGVYCVLFFIYTYVTYIYIYVKHGHTYVYKVVFSFKLLFIFF